MKLVIDHLTRYGYDEEVKFSTQYLRLTLRSNLSVGLPLDTLLYRSGSLSSAGQHRITDSDPYFNRIRKAWSEGLLHTFQTLPTWTPAEREEE